MSEQQISLAIMAAILLSGFWRIIKGAIHNHRLYKSGDPAGEPFMWDKVLYALGGTIVPSLGAYFLTLNWDMPVDATGIFISIGAGCFLGYHGSKVIGKTAKETLGDGNFSHAVQSIASILGNWLVSKSGGNKDEEDK